MGGPSMKWLRVDSHISRIPNCIPGPNMSYSALQIGIQVYLIRVKRLCWPRHHGRKPRLGDLISPLYLADLIFKACRVQMSLFGRSLEKITPRRCRFKEIFWLKSKQIRRDYSMWYKNEIRFIKIVNTMKKLKRNMRSEAVKQTSKEITRTSLEHLNLHRVKEAFKG